jgi:SNF2 family DNA or RNA helicase
MKVFPQHKSLALRVRDPHAVKQLIPGTRVFHQKDKFVAFVPHHMDSVKVLRNMGVSAPPPIWYYYDYPKYEGRYAPFEHQIKTAEFVTLHHRCAVLNAPRTGKTLACLWAADYMMREGLVKKVLIVSPLSTLQDVWGNALYSTFYERTFVVLHGSRKHREKMASEDFDFYIVNHDGFDIVKDTLRDKVDLVIYDEAAVLRNNSTSRFKSFQAFIEDNPTRLWLLTGTPTPNEPTDAWALCKLIGVEDLPRQTRFRDMVMEKSGQWKWRPREGAEQTVYAYLQPSIRFSRDDCFDLPDTVIETRHCEMTKHQAKLFKEMMREMAMEVQGNSITAVNAAVKIGKCLQLLTGVVYDNEGNEVYIGCEPRISVIKEVIEECSEKVIVFVPYTGALMAMAESISQIATVELIYGGVTASKRNEIFASFRGSPNPRVLVADARTMAHGLDLTAATTVIWAAPTYSNEVYEQACARIKGPKQKHKTTIVHIEGSTLEKLIYKRLSEKQESQDSLLEIVQQQGGMI